MSFFSSTSIAFVLDTLVLYTLALYAFVSYALVLYSLVLYASVLHALVLYTFVPDAYAYLKMGLKRFISWAKKTAKRKWEEKRARDHPFDLEKTYTESVHATEFNNSPKAPCNPYIARQNEIIEWRTRLRRYFQDDQWEFSALHLVFLTTILHHNFRLLRLVNWVEGVSTLVYHGMLDGFRCINGRTS